MVEKPIPEDKYREKKKSDPLKKTAYQNLYSDTRSWILWCIKELENSKNSKNRSLTDIAKCLDKRAGDINHDIDALRKQKWIKLDEREYKLSFLGDIIFSNIDDYFLEFFLKHTKYFLNHDFGILPKHFQLGIGVFRSCQLLESESGHIFIARKELEVIRNSEKFVNNMIGDGTFSKDILDTLKQKAENNNEFHIRTILPKDTLPPPSGIEGHIQKIDHYLKPNMRENKKNEIVNIGIVMNEKEAMVMFPSSKSKRPDASSAFYGTDPEFLEWCLDYFEHCWKS